MNPKESEECFEFVKCEDELKMRKKGSAQKKTAAKAAVFFWQSLRFLVSEPASVCSPGSNRAGGGGTEARCRRTIGRHCFF